MIKTKSENILPNLCKYSFTLFKLPVTALKNRVILKLNISQLVTTLRRHKRVPADKYFYFSISENIEKIPLNRHIKFIFKIIFLCLIMQIVFLKLIKSLRIYYIPIRIILYRFIFPDYIN